MPVRHSLLGLLALKPRYGYELRAAFTALAGGSVNWNVKPAQIYTTLSRLEESAFITSADGSGRPDRQVFSITSAGRAELDAWLQSPVDDEPQQDEFYIKLMLALSLDPQNAPALIQKQRSALYQHLHNITTQRIDLDPRCELAHILLLDKAIMHLEADLRWLDMIESRLEDVSAQPVPEAEMRPRGRPSTRKQIRPHS